MKAAGKLPLLQAECVLSEEIHSKAVARVLAVRLLPQASVFEAALAGACSLGGR